MYDCIILDNVPVFLLVNVLFLFMSENMFFTIICDFVLNIYDFFLEV